jgi:hypothetical protein
MPIYVIIYGTSWSTIVRSLEGDHIRLRYMYNGTE